MARFNQGVSNFIAHSTIVFKRIVLKYKYRRASWEWSLVCVSKSLNLLGPPTKEYSAEKEHSVATEINHWKTNFMLVKEFFSFF
jgi:hypothetical protein